MFNIKNECISTLVSSYREAASFTTSKFLEYNTENEEFEKSKVMQKCPLTHIIMILIMIIILIIIIIIIIIIITIVIVIIITIIIIKMIIITIIIIIIIIILTSLVGKFVQFHRTEA